MSKSKEELNAIKEEVEVVNEKLQELTPEEIAQVSGGIVSGGIIHLHDCVSAGTGVPVLPGFEPGVTAAGAELSGHVQVRARPAL